MLPHSMHSLTCKWRIGIGGNGTKQRVGRVSLSRNATVRHMSSSPIRTSLLIVGGGPVGLFLANLLQRYCVDFHLLEAQTEKEHFQHPQAHFLNTRTMEILKHFTPSIFDRVVQAMSPVEEWKQFRFGPNMTTLTPMATVEHPVDVPLMADKDANGRLIFGNEHATRGSTRSQDSFYLSDCSVGHVAQHTFHRILYEEAIHNIQMSNSNSSIEFGSKVVNATRRQEDGLWHVTTNTGQQYVASMVVAADGVRSAWRREYLNVGMSGQKTIQNLISVHFSLSFANGQDPPNELIPPAMLYTIFSPDALAMVVRHSPKDYVMQIPYFPPYQTPQNDFSHSRVEQIIRATIGNDEALSTNLTFRIHSIRPWTMGSMVANSYAQDNVYLVGDAAHVFPPAGGFGMNTGLQDALALAWRIQIAGAQPSLGRETSFTRERQAVARNNAALSVRNYQRVLNVMKSCYLDERSLPFLLQGLEASANMGMPMSWQKSTFQTLYRTALQPLRFLIEAPNSPYTRHVTNNLRRLLSAGQGLPLLFPNHEVQFEYPTQFVSSQNQDHDVGIDRNQNSKLVAADTLADHNGLVAGRLFPHVPVHIFNPHGHALGDDNNYDPLYSNNLSFISAINNNDNGGAANNMITTRDLPIQLSSPRQPCPFCLLEVVHGSLQPWTEGVTLLQETTSMLEKDLGVSVIPAQLWTIPRSMETSRIGSNDLQPQVFTMFVDETEWKKRTTQKSPAGQESNIDRNGRVYRQFILIRPDGHVASISDKYQKLLNDAKYILGL